MALEQTHGLYHPLQGSHPQDSLLSLWRMKLGEEMEGV